MTNDDRAREGTAADRQGVSLEVIGAALVFFNLILVCVAIAVGSILLRSIDSQADRSTQAICAIIVYAERQASVLLTGDADADPPRPPNPRSAEELEKLSDDMRSTGVDCPPRKDSRE